MSPLVRSVTVKDASLLRSTRRALVDAVITTLAYTPVAPNNRSRHSKRRTKRVLLPELLGLNRVFIGPSFLILAGVWFYFELHLVVYVNEPFGHGYPCGKRVRWEAPN